jgi:transcriptional regulator with XRE-family HTH domain
MFATQSEILNRALKKMKTSNAKISIRALASRLGISHVFLGKVIRGQVLIPARLIPQIGKAFRLDEFDVSALRNLVFEKRMGLEEDAEMAVRPSNFSDYIDLPEDKFKYFSNWWSFAALDLMTCDLPLNWTRSSLASLLGISRSELDPFLEAMIEIQVVTEKDKILRKAQSKLRLPTSTPQEYTKNIYQQIAGLTKKELTKRGAKDFEKRLILGYCCSVNPKKIATAKTIMAKAVKECAEVLSEGPCTDVYWVQGQMFSLLDRPK